MQDTRPVMHAVSQSVGDELGVPWVEVLTLLDTLLPLILDCINDPTPADLEDYLKGQDMGPIKRRMVLRWRERRLRRAVYDKWRGDEAKADVVADCIVNRLKNISRPLATSIMHESGMNRPLR